MSSEDIKAARDCVIRACLSSRWDWKGGSRPFYWRWLERCQKVIRDGRPNYIIGPLPSRFQAQRPPKAGVLVKVKETTEEGYWQGIYHSL